MVRIPVICITLCGAALFAACGDDEAPPSPSDAGPPDAGDVMMCAEPRSVPDGHPCRCGSDCGLDAVCFAETQGIEAGGAFWAGGACLRDCNPAAPDCAAGYTCAPVPPGLVPGSTLAGLCAPNCTDGSECHRTHSCADFGAFRVCFPYCQGDGECESGHCDRYLGLCAAGPFSVGGDLGAPCVSDDDCRGFCDNGICSARCSVSRQGCPDDGLCFSLATAPDSDFGYCGVPCESEADCAAIPGSRCLPYAGRPAGGMVCSP